MACSLSGSSARGISQARILEWVAISFFRASSWLRDWTHISCIERQILYHWATREALADDNALVDDEAVIVEGTWFSNWPHGTEPLTILEDSPGTVNAKESSFFVP